MRIILGPRIARVDESPVWKATEAEFGPLYTWSDEAEAAADELAGVERRTIPVDAAAVA